MPISRQVRVFVSHYFIARKYVGPVRAAKAAWSFTKCLNDLMRNWR